MKERRITYKHTVYACFVGYITQAIVNNFAPLLFLTFVSSYGVPLSKITLLVTFNFGFQLFIDAVSPRFIDKIGYRFSMILAHVFSAAGLVMLTILPELFEDAFVGLLLAVLIYAIGGGLLEVLVSPVVEACPTDNKEATMSLLHSFYCWGHVGVVLISTIYFAVFGIENWKYLACFWALVPALNCISFTKVPIATLIEEGETGLSLKELFRNKVFWLFMIMMVSAGASEQAVSQWASAFAEAGLGVDKTIGDLAGPMLFAVCMGISRAIYGKYGDRIKLEYYMLFSGVLCILSYLMISLSPWPMLSFIGCAICGFSVGIMWPGTFSMSAAGIKNGGTLMFALFALAGDVGCSAGPTLVGMVSSVANNNLKLGTLAAIFFPILCIICCITKMKSVK